MIKGFKVFYVGARCPASETNRRHCRTESPAISLSISKTEMSVRRPAEIPEKNKKKQNNKKKSKVCRLLQSRRVYHCWTWTHKVLHSVTICRRRPAVAATRLRSSGSYLVRDALRIITCCGVRFNRAGVLIKID